MFDCPFLSFVFHEVVMGMNCKSVKEEHVFTHMLVERLEKIQNY